jgi:hypothetical protein
MKSKRYPARRLINNVPTRIITAQVSAIFTVWLIDKP